MQQLLLRAVLPASARAVRAAEDRAAAASTERCTSGAAAEHSRRLCDDRRCLAQQLVGPKPGCPLRATPLLKPHSMPASHSQSLSCVTELTGSLGSLRTVLRSCCCPARSGPVSSLSVLSLYFDIAAADPKQHNERGKGCVSSLQSQQAHTRRCSCPSHTLSSVHRWNSFIATTTGPVPAVRV